MNQFQISDRLRVAEEFFATYPGLNRSGFGLGRSFIDFMYWEISSGRLMDTRGSLWWNSVNERMISDLLVARRGSRDDCLDRSSGSAWVDYVFTSSSDDQALFWTAHQLSLSRAVEKSRPFLEREPGSERKFIELALGVITAAARLGIPSDDGTLRVALEEIYPKKYPATDVEVNAIEDQLELVKGQYLAI